METMNEFYSKFSNIYNNSETRSIILSGNVHDLFWNEKGYVPLIPFMCERGSQANGLIQIVYELNGPIEFVDEKHKEVLKTTWANWKRSVGDVDQKDAASQMFDNLRNLKRGLLAGDEGESAEDEFERRLHEAIGQPSPALEFMRQLCIASRNFLPNHNLMIYVEAADLLLPHGEITSLRDYHLHRITIMHDWFCDPAFMDGHDSVVLLANSRSLVNSQISQLPQVLGVDVAAPNEEERKHFIKHEMSSQRRPGYIVEKIGTELPKQSDAPVKVENLSALTAGLNLHAIRQMLRSTKYTPTPKDVVVRVEEYIKRELGEDVVEFKKPEHTLDSCVGNSNLKHFLQSELIPRFKATDKRKSLSGAAVAGPIGGGKTFIFEAVATELGIPVLVLKNIRSQWFGQTDVVFEKLKRVLESLEKVVIFIDEADTQFGGVGADSHSTERRLTGKIQAMMSDPRLKGRVLWLLMTARIHLLSPDIRRPGRVGDLIIPVLDPEDKDRREFSKWALGSIELNLIDDDMVSSVMELTEGYSAASYASLRSNLAALFNPDAEDVVEEIERIIDDQIPPNIGEQRSYQILQALNNTTRKSLLPNKYRAQLKGHKKKWAENIAEMEFRGFN